MNSGKMTGEGPRRPKRIKAYRKASLALALTAFASVLTSSTPGLACLRTPSLAAVDAALSGSKVPAPDHAKAVELRAELSGLLSQHRLREAPQVEARIMDTLGFRLAARRKSQIGWGRHCGGHWVAKTN
jgi:hypothetical protein